MTSADPRWRARVQPLPAILMGAVEVAAHLAVHVNTVKRIAPADLSYFRIGNRGDRRYDLVDVERYKEDRRAR